VFWVDARRAAFKIGGVTYASKLVDLPCIIESQKTFDNSHLFKVADISQVSFISPRYSPHIDRISQADDV
jgi:transcription initiation factor TFIID subunit 7